MNYYSANVQTVTARGTTIEGGLRPDLAGPESDDEFRRHIENVAGRASVTPFVTTLADLVTSWFGPLGIGDGGEVRGELDGASVQVTAPNVRDMLRRPGLAGQLGVEVRAADLDAALMLVAQRARAEHERRTVAEQHQRERERVELVEDVAVAETRARLLRELAELNDVPPGAAPVADVRPVPVPPKRSWRRS